MATDAPDRIAWLLEIPQVDSEFLAGIRHWKGLRIASAESSLWIEGFEHGEITSAAVRSLPRKNIWRKEGPLLFANENRVPARKAPALLWTPIARGLPLELPDWNHAYAVTEQPVPVQLVRAALEAPVVAMIITLDDLARYIETCSAIRLNPLRWTILPPDRALVYGSPVLPLPGQSFWQEDRLLLPAGYRLRFPELRELILARIGAEKADTLVLMNEHGSWSQVPQASLTQLSIGSFRQSVLLTPQTAPDGKAD